MQSGQVKTKEWALDFEPEEARRGDPPIGSGDMKGQVRLTFDSRDEVVAYAPCHRIAQQVFGRQKPKRSVRAYADSFNYTRKGLWTRWLLGPRASLPALPFVSAAARANREDGVTGRRLEPKRFAEGGRPSN